MLELVYNMEQSDIFLIYISAIVKVLCPYQGDGNIAYTYVGSENKHCVYILLLHVYIYMYMCACPRSHYC